MPVSVRGIAGASVATVLVHWEKILTLKKIIPLGIVIAGNDPKRSAREHFSLNLI